MPAFAGLPYYDVDEGRVFEGLTLEPYSGGEPTTFTIPTSDGKLRPAERAGTFRFTVDGAACTLTAYTFEHDNSGAVFVPFLDATSGRETYGAGRYLDLEPDEDGTYTHRLQSRLPPVVRLRRPVLVPADAGREPAVRSASRPVNAWPPEG